MTKSLLANIATGAKWTAINRIAIRLLSFVSTMILARLLTPHDFGLVALGAVFINLLTLLGSFDFETVLIQHSAPTREHYHTAWTLNAVYFSLATIGLVIAAPHLANYFAVPQLSDILYVLAAGFLAKGFASVKIIDFQRHFRFHYDTLLRTSVKLAGFIATVTSAFILRSYWSLLIGTLAAQATYLVLSYVLAPYRPRPTFLYTKELFSFSGWLVIANFISFINTKSVELIVGKVLGTWPLGIYTVSDSSAGTTQEFTSTVNRASYPGYAKVSQSVSDLKHLALRIIGVISTIAFPAALGLYSVAFPFVLAVLGRKWRAAAPILGIIAIAVLLRSLQSNVSYVLYALRRPKLHAAVSAIKAALMLPLIYFLSVHQGIEGAAFAVLAASAAVLPVNLYLLYRLVAIRPGELLAVGWRPAVSAGIMALVLHAILDAWQAPRTETAAAAVLLGSIGLGVLCYATVLVLLWNLSGRPDSVERDALRWVQARWNSLRQSPSNRN